MTVNEAGKLGAERRQQSERELIRETARAICAALGMPASSVLSPTLVLTSADRF